jgi:hypothetical protein
MYIYPLEEIKKQRKKQVRKLLIHLQDSNISTNASKTSLISVTVKENSTEILGYVNSSNSSKKYEVVIPSQGKSTCTCDYYKYKYKDCKHIYITGLKYVLYHE